MTWLMKTVLKPEFTLWKNIIQYVVLNFHKKLKKDFGWVLQCDLQLIFGAYSVYFIFLVLLCSG